MDSESHGHGCNVERYEAAQLIQINGLRLFSKLWDNYYKDNSCMGLLPYLQCELLEVSDNTNPKMKMTITRCQVCLKPLQWIFNWEQSDELAFLCPNIGCPFVNRAYQLSNHRWADHYKHKYLITKCDYFTGVLIDLLNHLDYQLVAIALIAVIKSGVQFNRLIPMPNNPDDPFDVLSNIWKSTPNLLRLGGEGIVVFADIHRNDMVPQFPVLILTDTVRIPPRAVMFPLKYLSDQSNNNTTEFLINELIDIGNKVLQSHSFLVLGKRLQHLIPCEMWQSHKNHNLIIVPYNSLLTIDKSKLSDSKTRNAKNILKHMKSTQAYSRHVLDTVFQVIFFTYKNDIGSFEMSTDQLYLLIRQTIASAVWLTVFSDTPFEPFLYYILYKIANE